MKALTVHIDYEVLEAHTDTDWPGLRILDKIRVRAKTRPHECPDPADCGEETQPVDPYEWQYARGNGAPVEP